MKFVINKKMNGSVAFRGRVVKMLIPKAGMTYFRVGNAVLDKLLIGRKLKNFFTGEVYSPRRDGSNIRACLCSRRGVTDNAIRLIEDDLRSELSSTLKHALVQRKKALKSKSRPAFLWIHGGGYAMGSPEQEFYFIKRILEAIDAVVLSPDYTRSVDAPYPKALEDCYDSLLWLKENAEKLGADPNKIFVGGDSAGGGLCAALCLYARDKGEVNVAFQAPLYPMIDDRPTCSNQNNSTPCWDSQSNDKAWSVYLGKLYGTKNVSCYAAPARATDLSGLPPTLTYVGDIEPFYAETVDFVKRLRLAGVPTDFRIYSGCYHGFDVICPDSAPGKNAIAFFKDGLIKAEAKCYAPQPQKKDSGI